MTARRLTALYLLLLCTWASIPTPSDPGFHVLVACKGARKTHHEPSDLINLTSELFKDMQCVERKPEIDVIVRRLNRDSFLITNAGDKRVRIAGFKELAADQSVMIQSDAMMIEGRRCGFRVKWFDGLESSSGVEEPWMLTQEGTAAFAQLATIRLAKARKTLFESLSAAAVTASGVDDPPELRGSSDESLTKFMRGLKLGTLIEQIAGLHDNEYEIKDVITWLICKDMCDWDCLVHAFYILETATSHTERLGRFHSEAISSITLNSWSVKYLMYGAIWLVDKFENEVTFLGLPFLKRAKLTSKQLDQISLYLLIAMDWNVYLSEEALTREKEQLELRTRNILAPSGE